MQARSILLFLSVLGLALSTAAYPDSSNRKSSPLACKYDVETLTTMSFRDCAAQGWRWLRLRRLRHTNQRRGGRGRRHPWCRSAWTEQLQIRKLLRGASFD